MSDKPELRTLVADPSPHMAGLVTLMLHSLKIKAVDETDLQGAQHTGDQLSHMY